MARRAAYLDKARTSPGNRLLISGGDVFPPGGMEERAKGVSMAKALRLMKYDAVGVGEFDFAFGAPALVEAMKGLPMVASNLVWADNQKPIFETSLLRTYKDFPGSQLTGKVLRVAILGLVDDRMQSSIDFYMEKEPRKVKVLPAAETLRQMLPKIRAHADYVVVIAHMNLGDMTQLATLVPGVDFMLAGHASEQQIDPPKRVGNTWLVANGDRGRFIGEMRMNFDPDLKPLEPITRVLPLDDKVGKDSVLEAVVEEFKTSLGAEREKDIKTQSLAGKPVAKSSYWQTYNACVICHKTIVDHWLTTGHAQAFATLVKNNDQHREECLQCHVLALGQEGGYDIKAPDDSRKNVQCENCHGSGERHANAGTPEERKRTIVGHPEAAVCAKCHTDKQDPEFSFAKRWAKIQHPK